MSFKKGKNTFKKVVVVDWHNTLETLMLLAEAHIISWVGSQRRYDSTLKQIQEELPQETLKKVKSYRRIYTLLGQEGKVDWACWLEAEAIFDDNADVIKQARRRGWEGYSIQAWGNSHSGKTFWSFADAMDQWVVDQKKTP